MTSFSLMPIAPGVHQPALQRDVSRAGRLADQAGKHQDKEALMKVSREFESLFLNMMLKEMRSTVPKYDPLHSYGEETYQELLDQEWTKDMVKNRSMGLADMVYRQLSQLESVSEKPGGEL